MTFSAGSYVPPLRPTAFPFSPQNAYYYNAKQERWDAFPSNVNTAKLKMLFVQNIVGHQQFNLRRMTPQQRKYEFNQEWIQTQRNLIAQGIGPLYPYEFEFKMIQILGIFIIIFTTLSQFNSKL